MKAIINMLSLIAITTLLFTACQDEDPPVSPSVPSDHKGSQASDGMIKLGKRINNPFTLEIMRQAADNINAKVDVSTSHLYVKFKPKNEEEVALLQQDTTLILYTYPLDYEIAEGGVYYHDPSLPADQPTYRYASVKADHQLSKEVDYEVLEALYIPTEMEVPNGRLDEATAEALEDEAYRLTGNLEEVENTKTARSKWRPAGRIMFNDDILGNVPMQGVEVRARKLFTTHKGITDATGRFSCDGRFRDRANYSIQWERYQFVVTTGGLLNNTALYNGPKIRNDWNLTINRGGKSHFYANIYRAAFHYYYQNINGIRRPPSNGILKYKMKIGANYEENIRILGDHGAWRRVLHIDRIRIFNPQLQTVSVYATTIHELAHASHWGMDRSDFNDTESKVKESWARGVQWELTRMVYPNYLGGGTIRPNYTQVVVDLIDFPVDRNNGAGAPSDQVQGYSIRQIEDALNGQESWNSWRDNIINRYNNGTEANVPTLFSFWN